MTCSMLNQNFNYAELFIAWNLTSCVSVGGMTELALHNQNTKLF